MNKPPSIVNSKHFDLKVLADGVYACIHKPGGAAYSNAGIIDLGGRTLLVDAFDTLAAGRDLRQTAEALFARPVDTILLTHPHSDHWVGASAFETSTMLLCSKTTRRICRKWGAEIIKDIQNPAQWQQWVKEMEAQLQTEPDERLRVGLERAIARARFTMAEMEEFQPRYADQIFTDKLLFQENDHQAEFRSMGRGHSEDDAVLLLPKNGIAFIGDIGFFATQPFLGFCDIELYRQQLLFFQDSDFQILVPGHGPVGGKEDVVLQIKYFDVMEDLVGEAVQRGASLSEAMQITLPEPFDKWLVGGMERFKVNVRTVFAHLGGEVPTG